MKIVSEVVKVFDCSSIKVINGEDLCFRLEVSKSLEYGTFIGKVYRLETYRLQPTFPQKDGIVPDIKNDALIYVADEMFDLGKLQGVSIEEVILKFEEQLSSLMSY